MFIDDKDCKFRPETIPGKIERGDWHNAYHHLYFAFNGSKLLMRKQAAYYARDFNVQPFLDWAFGS